MSAEKVDRLSTTAETLAGELRRYEELAVGLERERLDSEKNLRRAARSLGALHESEVRLREHVAAVILAIADARSRQEAQAAVVQAQAVRIGERGEVLSALLRRWSALGEGAAAVNQLVQQSSTARREPKPAGGGNGIGSALREIDERLTHLADEAESLAQTAHEELFVDLARQAEGLRGQLLSARNKMRLARSDGTEE